MKRSRLEKLWEGTLPLGNLKVMDMSESKYLEVIPDLSKAINLYELRLSFCISLVTLPSSIQNFTKLFVLNMEGCKKLENIPTLLNLESLAFFNVFLCEQLRNFPMINLRNSLITVESCLWSRNLPEVVLLDCLMRYMPRQYRPEHFIYIRVNNNKIEKLWEGVQPFVSLEEIDVSDCDYLKEIPDLSKATNLRTLKFFRCKSLLMVPSTIGNLQKLEELHISDCLVLKVLPIDVNLSSLRILDFSGCSRLSMFPKISSNIEKLYLNGTAIEGVPCFIENFSRLKILNMRDCRRLKNISPNIFRLKNLQEVDFAYCGDVMTVLSDVNAVTTTEDHFFAINVGNSCNLEMISDYVLWDNFLDFHCGEYFSFENCFKLDEDAREFISRSCFKPTILPGGEVSTYFKHRAFGNSLNFTLPQSLLSQDVLQFKACVVFEAPFYGLYLDVHFLFNGLSYEDCSYVYRKSLCKTDHLVLCSFDIQPTDLSSTLELNNLEFKFGSFGRIKECGVRLLNVSLSPDGSDGNYETFTYNQQSGDKRDVVETGGSTKLTTMVLMELEPMIETGGSKKRMRMASETSRENCNLPCDQNEVDESLELTMWPKLSE